MAVSTDKQTYDLSMHELDTDTKTIIYVKFTESAMSLIEAHCRKTKQNSKPTIQFKNTQGSIKFPSSTTNSGPSFDFVVTKEVGLVECLRKTGPTTLESFGHARYKTQIRSDNDENIFKAIHSKGAMADREAKKKYLPGVVKESEARAKPIPITRKITATKGVNVKPILQRSLRERVVHLIAIQPCRKSDLIVKLMVDGVGNRGLEFDKLLMAILNGVAVLENDKLDLRRHVWKEVRVDWPFYRGDEKQLVECRRPDSVNTGIKRPMSDHISAPNKRVRCGK